MAINIDELFSKTIDASYRLDRESKSWLLKNGNVIQLKTPTNKSCGFSMDVPKKNASTESPFPFISGNPPLHIGKICDAIICLSYKNKDYIFVIEKKTRNEDDYKLQLINGKHFCDWIVTLLKQHNHYTRQINYIALLVWEPRKITNKGLTTHRNKTKPVIPPRLDEHFNRFEEVKNQSQIFLQEYL